jgi:hypothetical protein
MTPLERLRMPHYVYRLYDANMRLLYVGCTYSPRTRLGDHRRYQPWFPEVATTRVTAYPDAAEGYAAEAAAHASESPIHGYPHTAAAWVVAKLGEEQAA